MKPKSPPILVKDPITGSFYISTRYKDLGNGCYVLQNKHDVTEHVEAIVKGRTEQLVGQVHEALDPLFGSGDGSIEDPDPDGYVTMRVPHEAVQRTMAASRFEIRHTPGPWTVTAMTFDGCGEGECAFIVRASGGMEMHAPNMRLIEAAPDMYEALTGDQDAPESLRPIQWAWGLLQDYEEMLRRHRGQHSDPEAAWEHVSRVRRMLTLIQAALAKAEGREVTAGA